jgi:hypothetical protein
MTRDRIAERAAEHLAMARGMPRFQALSEAERMAWAQRRAESELAKVAWLPGGLSWSKIENAYRTLAGERPGLGRDHGRWSVRCTVVMAGRVTWDVCPPGCASPVRWQQ